MLRKLSLFTAILMLLAVPTFAQDMMTPSVTVADQVVTHDQVIIDEIYSEGPGFIVIHADNEGSFGAVIGHRAINAGTSVNVAVDIDVTMATPVLYAMLHSDTGEMGVYEFGTVEGADGPVAVDGEVVTPDFNAAIISVYPQLIDMNTVHVHAATVAEDGFVVIHAGDAESFGAVVGFAPISAGTTTSIDVPVEGLDTDYIWPMLHTDTGEMGTYEFGTVEGADGPIAIDGNVATMARFVGAPSVHVHDQIVTDTVTASSVVSEGPGWLVIHADNDGAPGPVIGQTLVDAGTTANVVVEVDAMGVTPVLWPMLHVDTGEMGTYEFGTVEGADGPVFVNDAVLTFPINAAPSISYEGTLDGNTLTVDSALIDTQGWLVIHADNEGAPGAVLGQTPLVSDLNEHVAVTLDGDITETVFPMLHVDTGEMGVYEFGMVEGADGPVTVNDAVVTGPLTPGMMME
ncbi:MAG: hypothetical protein CL607_07040 [Anaerolineaceae bacterium]|nr:hypothetical protein [Anaerolineaceae bacterium]